MVLVFKESECLLECFEHVPGCYLELTAEHVHLNML
jgi:hypothetical protein